MLLSEILGTRKEIEGISNPKKARDITLFSIVSPVRQYSSEDELLHIVTTKLYLDSETQTLLRLLTASLKILVLHRICQRPSNNYGSPVIEASLDRTFHSKVS